MKKNCQTFAGIVCFLVLSCFFPPAFAAPTLSGSTGMIRIPTADVLRPGQFSAGAWYWENRGASVLAVGVAPNFEISAGAPWNTGSADAWTVNAKVNLTQEALLIPAVAVGVEDIDGRGRGSFYGVVSKVLPFGFRVHIGAGTGRFDGMFAAVEKVLNPTSIKKQGSGFPVTSLILEMDGAKLNVGARMRLARGLRLDVGWLGQEERMVLGLTYTN